MSNKWTNSLWVTNEQLWSCDFGDFNGISKFSKLTKKQKWKVNKSIHLYTLYIHKEIKLNTKQLVDIFEIKTKTSFILNRFVVLKTFLFSSDYTPLTKKQKGLWCEQQSDWGWKWIYITNKKSIHCVHVADSCNHIKS